MKKIIAVSMLLAVSVSATANYVSPLKYKGLTCEEMLEEEQFLIVSSIDATTGALSAEMDKNHVEHVRLNNLSSSINTHQAALTEAMKRINCKRPEQK